MDRIKSIRGAWPYLIVVFLNAFVFIGHITMLEHSLYKAYEGQEQMLFSAMLNGIILLPFIAFLTPAGFISNKYPKNKVMKLSALGSVLLTLFISFSYYQGLFGLSFILTLLLATQVVVFSPAKYSMIKEIFGKEQLGEGNSIVQAVSICAILLSVMVFSLLFEMFCNSSLIDSSKILYAIAPLSILLVIGSVIELAISYKLKEVKTDNLGASEQFSWKKYRTAVYLKESINPFLQRKVIRLSIIGLAMFSSMAQILFIAFPTYSQISLGLDDTFIIQSVILSSGVGLILGSILAGRWSKNHIEIGLIPLGAVGLAISFICIPFVFSLTALSFCFFAAGVMGGIFIVPLNALIQFYSNENEITKIMALRNWIQSLGMIFVLLITTGFILNGATGAFLLKALAVIALGTGLYTLYLLPQSLARILISLLLSNHYKISIQGMKNIPETGGVLLLGNHISWVDWAIIQIASPRPVHFVLEKPIFNVWYLKPFFKALGCIPIDRSSSNEAEMEQVTALLNRERVVALFPELEISKNGQLAEFCSDYEVLCSKVTSEMKIIPFYIRGLWGSKFSLSSNKLKELRAKVLSRDLVVAFGPAMGKETKVAQLKLKVFDLSEQSWQHHVLELPSIGCAWIDTVKKIGSKSVITDDRGTTLTAEQALVGAICIRQHIVKSNKNQNVGILLPTSAGGCLANMAGILAGKTIVNLNYTSSQIALANSIEQSEIKQIYTSKLFIQKLEKRGLHLAPALENVKLIYLEELLKSIKKPAKITRFLLVKFLPRSLLKLLYLTDVETNKPAAILFSSGSEGAPKGVMLSHSNIMANLKQVADVLNASDNDVILGSLPLFHAFGLTVTQFMPLVEGLPLVCVADPTDAVAMGKSVAKNQATVMFGTSTFFRIYAKNRKLYPQMFSSLRIVVAGAEKLNSEVRNAFEKKFYKPILEGYGTTETTPVVSVNLPDQLDPVSWNIQTATKEGTVGMPLPGTSFKIVDPETFDELPTGEAGMILIGGVQVMLGYLNNPEKTSEVIKEIDDKRWYITGDKGKLDHDGFLTILDRYSRFAKLGGEMVSLTTIEEAVREVYKLDIELVAVSLEDQQKGECIVLLYEGELDKVSIKKAMLDSGCNPLMIPKRWYCVEQIPKLGSGKTDFSQSKKLALSLS